MEKNKQILLGAHMPAAGGLENAIIHGESLGCTAIQLFTKSNRQWQAKPLTEAQAALFKKARSLSSIESITAHACYLINIATEDTEMAKKSITSLAIELQRCNDLGIDALTFHPGAYTSGTLVQGICQATLALNLILENTHGPSMLLVEMMAGQGTVIGSTIEQLAAILDGVDQKKRVGVCIDTCHIVAAGYHWSTKKQYEEFWHTFDKLIGIHKVHAFHLNDSKNSLGSKKDRHEDIGKGKMGTEPFRLLLNDKNFDHVPKILETPKSADLHEDAANLATLVHLLDESRKKICKGSPLTRYL